MERLTKVIGCPDGTKIYDISNKLLGLNISSAAKTRMIFQKLAEYEDLEDRLNKVYGDCDGLLPKVVEMLEKHPYIDMANSTSKSRLLTDEDVDKWNEYKRLEEQDRLIKLPCRVGADIYYYRKLRVRVVGYKRNWQNVVSLKTRSRSKTERIEEWRMRWKLDR